MGWKYSNTDNAENHAVLVARKTILKSLVIAILDPISKLNIRHIKMSLKFLQC